MGFGLRGFRVLTLVDFFMAIPDPIPGVDDGTDGPDIYVYN